MQRYLKMCKVLKIMQMHEQIFKSHRKISQNYWESTMNIAGKYWGSTVKGLGIQGEYVLNYLISKAIKLRLPAWAWASGSVCPHLKSFMDMILKILLSPDVTISNNEFEV